MSIEKVMVSVAVITFMNPKGGSAPLITRSCPPSVGFCCSRGSGTRQAGASAEASIKTSTCNPGASPRGSRGHGRSRSRSRSRYGKDAPPLTSLSHLIPVLAIFLGFQGGLRFRSAPLTRHSRVSLPLQVPEDGARVHAQVLGGLGAVAVVERQHLVDVIALKALAGLVQGQHRLQDLLGEAEVLRAEQGVVG